MNAHVTKKVLFALLIAGFLLTPRPVYAGLLDQLLESAVGGSSNSNSGNGSANRALQDRSQTLREDEQRLDEAYSQLRQKQAAGQDVTEDMAKIQNLEATYRGRKQQVRELQWQAQREEEYARRQAYQRQQYQNQNGNYSNNSFNQNSYDNGYGQRAFDNDPYSSRSQWQDEDNGGFKVRFGG